MSRLNCDLTANNGFVLRLIEVCGTDSPSEIKQLLNISYQAAKNYLTGRLPDTQHLLRITEDTDYSIHWLLTGEGKKFVDGRHEPGTPVSSRQFEQSVRKIVLDVINDMSGGADAAQPRVVVLQSSEILSEEAASESLTSSGDRKKRSKRSSNDS